ncbi:MAG: methyltransferase domain-containing protein [Acidimicrobiia bacterium]|nr:methyltransferase domain-containing protein [Acidimicrobiia bacterium]
MSAPYGRPFARYYDLLYSDKDYAAECDLVEAVFSRYGAAPRTILDAGCGSGGHAIELARRGYRVIGVDRSEGLLECAARKVTASGADVTLHRQEIAALSLPAPADACVCLFAVLGFQRSNADLHAALRAIRHALADGALLVCDVWNGNAVLREGPVPRLKQATDGTRSLWRFATPVVDTTAQTVTLTQQLLVTGGPDGLDLVTEAQTVRYLLPQELTFHLEAAGFDVLEIFPFPRPGEPLTDRDWSLGAVARAVRSRQP